MRRSLWAALSRVERLAVDAQRQSDVLDPEWVVAVLQEGRRRAALGIQLRRTPEDSLARGRALRAILAAERNTR